MPKTRKHWVITRPKRKLILVPDLLKIFHAVANGEKWRRNRELQTEFEKQLVSAQWKAQNTSVSASGGRTYANLLFMLGLWFEDKNGVQLTNAGIEIIEDNPPVPIITKQLLDFQYPSPYSQNRNVNIHPSFRIQPHRFVIMLMLKKNLEEISQEEVAFCLAPFAKTINDLDKCHELILEYREKPQKIIEKAVNESGATKDNLKNIGNTLVNQMEYTGLFEVGDDAKTLTFNLRGKENAKEILAELRTTLVTNPEDETTFQMRYGSGLKTSKDYRYTSSTPATVNPNERVVLLAYYEIALNEPIQGITEELISRISRHRGVPTNQVRKVLTSFAEKPMMDRFEEKYLQISKGGTETATDFEVKTNGIFSGEGFGFASVRVGPKPRHPDLFVYFDKNIKRHGIIDTKAYREYNLPLDHKNKMAYTYIPNFRKISFEGESYDLSFFSYIAGGYGNNMQRSFNELINMADIPGSYITAFSLLHLLRLHRQRKFGPEEFRKVFTCKKEIKYNEIRAN